ncbi:MAG: GNAT family N-acetyltransferase [Dehalococcoidia bacterium]|nr:GNAT family N-acetyltransferase [Dehalococcoidia bacterium]
MTYQETADGISPSDLQGFFAGWPNRPSPEGHLNILQGSDLLVLALSKSCKVVGFITAITDGVSCAYIPYLEVLPEWQRKGIGTELVTRMMENLKTIYAIDLICDEDVQGFYEKLGFSKRRGMTIRNYESQTL